MVRELVQVLIDLVPVEVLERVRNLAVQATPPRSGQVDVDRLADERVRERVAAREAVGLDQHAGANGLVERVEQRVGAAAGVGHALEQRQGHAGAGHRGDGEDLGGVLGQAHEPPADDLAHALRDPELFQRELAGRGEPLARVDDLAQDLADEEWVSARLLVHGARQGPALGVEIDVDLERQQILDLVGAQAGQRVTLDPGLAPQVGEHLDQGVRPGQLGVTERAHDADLHSRRGAHEVAEQQQRRSRGPVQVIEHEQQRRSPGDLGQEGDHGLEHQVLVEGRVGTGRRHRIGHQLSELGQHAGELGGAASRLRAHDLGRARGHVGAERLDEGLEGEPDILVAAAVEHDPALIEGLGGELPDEARLADPRLAGHQDDPPRSALGSLPGLLQRLELGLASDEVDSVAGRQRDRQRRVHRGVRWRGRREHRSGRGHRQGGNRDVAGQQPRVQAAQGP